MKALVAAALVIASASIATAAPWQTESSFDGDDLIGETAYQWENGGGAVVLGYECDAMFGFEAFYVQTGARYEDTTSYAPDVPTTLTIDGVPYEFSGTFQNREGYLFTFYDGIEDGFYALFDRLLLAKGSVDVTFFDKRFSFSAEGVGRALSTASELCY